MRLTDRGRGARWRVRSSVGEGLRNLRDGAVLGSALVAVTAAVVTSTTTLDIVTVATIVEAEEAYLRVGGDLLVAQRHEGTLSAAECVSLENLTGVRTAVALTVVPQPLRLTGRPASQQTVVTATPGILDLVHVPSLAADEVLVSRTIADRWQWSKGSRLQFERAGAIAHGVPTDPLTIAGTPDLALLEDAASTSVLAVVAADGDADRCYVRISPQYRDVLVSTIPAVLGDSEHTPVRVANRLPTGAFAQDPAAAFDTRPSRQVSLLAGGVVGLLWALVSWTRRGRAALYASLGVPYAGGVLIRWVEGVTAVVLGSAWGVALAASSAIVLRGTAVDLALELAVRHGFRAVSVASVCVLLVGLWRPATLTALKDR